MQEFADVLSREHVQLEFLLFKLVELRQLLTAGERSFWRWAGAEVSRANERVQLTEERRQQLLQECCADAGLEAERATLATLAQWSPEPWHTILEDYRTNVRRLRADIDAVRRDIRAQAETAGPWLAEIVDATYRPVAFGLPGPRPRPSDTSSQPR